MAVVGYALFQVPFVLMQEEFDRYSELFDELEEEADHDHGPISPWVDTPDARVLQAELPDFNKEDITVEVKNYKVLTIKGRMKLQNNSNQHVHAQFIRQIPLPEDVKAKDMTASVEDGVLIIKAPKSISPKPSKRLLAITN